MKVCHIDAEVRGVQMLKYNNDIVGNAGRAKL